MKYATFRHPILLWVLVLLAFAVLNLDHLIGAGADNCHELLQRAQEILAQRQPQEAQKPILMAIKTCPNNPRGYDLLGISYDMQNRLEEAQGAHRKAVALSPRVAAFHNNLAISYASAGKIAEAKNEFQVALRF